MTDAKQLLRDYIAAVWDEGDLGALDRFLAPNFQRHVSPVAPPLGLAQQRERLAGIRRAFPDVTITVEEMIAEGDLVAFRSTLRGTHRGQLLGLEPTDRVVSVGLVDLVRVVDGRFVEQWGGPDMLDLARQLGGTIVMSDG